MNEIKEIRSQQISYTFAVEQELISWEYINPSSGKQITIVRVHFCLQALATWENGTLIMRIQRLDSGKVQIIKRTRDGDTLIQVQYLILYMFRLISNLKSMYVKVNI